MDENFEFAWFWLLQYISDAYQGDCGDFENFYREAFIEPDSFDDSWGFMGSERN